MREYSRVSPSFWVGNTGRQIRSLGTECQVVAMYLLTSPHSNMLGLYYIPIPYISHETGIPFEGASKALRSLENVGFCHYHSESEVIWVVEMAKYQIGETLSENDKRVKGVENELERVPKCPLIKDFIERYGEAYHLKFKPENASPSEAPSKPLRSQEQEQEQKKKKHTSDSGESNSAASERKPKVFHGKVIATYHRLLPELRVVAPTRWPGSKRERALDTRLRESEAHRDGSFWRWFFCAVRTNPHWMGGNDRGWVADLGWLLERRNFDKVIEWGETHPEAVERELSRWYPEEVMSA